MEKVPSSRIEIFTLTRTSVGRGYVSREVIVEVGSAQVAARYPQGSGLHRTMHTYDTSHSHAHSLATNIYKQIYVTSSIKIYFQ